MRPGIIAIGIVLLFICARAFVLSFPVGVLFAIWGLYFIVGGLVEKMPGEKSNIMVRCESCGSLNHENAKYCNDCGTQFRARETLLFI